MNSLRLKIALPAIVIASLAFPAQALAHSQVSRLDAGADAVAVATDSTRNLVYVASRADNAIAVIDAVKLKKLATIPRLGTHPIALAIDPQRNRIFDLDTGTNAVTVYDGVTHAVLATIAVPATPQALTADSMTGRVYVTSDSGSKGLVSVIDELTYTVTAQFVSGPSARGIAVDPFLDRVYVADPKIFSLRVFNATSHALVANVGLGARPVGVADDPVHGVVWIAAPQGFVQVVDSDTNKLLKGFPLGALAVPSAVAVSEVSGHAYVANSGTGTVTLVEGAKVVVSTTTFVGGPVETLNVGPQPAAIAVDAANGRAFVAEAGSTKLGPLQRGSLAVVSKFDPLVDGFHFANSFTDALKVNIPPFGTVNLAKYAFGLCGGMAYGALDTFNAGGSAPSTSAAPGQGTALRGYLLQRLIDSLLPGQAAIVRQFLKWMALPLDDKYGITGLHKRSTREWKNTIKPELDAGHPVPLGLVKVALPKPVWDNHQVLAYDYFVSAGQSVIELYDPNYPDQTTYLWTGSHVETSDKQGLQQIGKIRGFFANLANYRTAHPFWIP